MKIRTNCLVALKCKLVLFLISCSETGNRSITIIETTDVHEVILPFFGTKK